VRRRAAALLAGIAAITSALGGCGGASGGGDDPHALVDAPSGAPDRVVRGPQGRVAQFVAECGYSHAAAADPIVYPGQPGASHLHVFFGNTTTDADSTYRSLLAGSTTCNTGGDTATYWAPALMSGRQFVEPRHAVAYYRAGPDVDPASLDPYPAGLMMIAGDATASEPQPVSVVSWSCGTGSVREPAPPDCAPELDLRLYVTFPDCWDGEHLDVPGHRRHVAYSAAGACPAGHPVPIPQLQLAVDYANPGPAAQLSLASGGVYSAHADFWNTWDQGALVREVESCLHRAVVCAVSG
jgi:hypothetical protein